MKSHRHPTCPSPWIEGIDFQKSVKSISIPKHIEVNIKMRVALARITGTTWEQR